MSAGAGEAARADDAAPKATTHAATRAVCRTLPIPRLLMVSLARTRPAPFTSAGAAPRVDRECRLRPARRIAKPWRSGKVQPTCRPCPQDRIGRLCVPQAKYQRGLDIGQSPATA